MKLIELHILQSFPVSCLNRDDVGSPKSATFGGVQRARISSQSLKRAIRLFAKEQLSDPRFGSLRTRYLVFWVENELNNEKIGEEKDRKEIAEAVAKHLNKDLDSEDKRRVKTALFFSPLQIRAIVKAIAGQLAEAGKLDVKAACAAAKTIPEDAVDIAFFGRMVASEPELTLEAAAMFSHALSTHQTSNEIDYFAAVDEKLPDDMPVGAAHTSSLEFNSATYYRYAAVNLGILFDEKHLAKIRDKNDRENLLRSFLESVIKAVPSARQNSMNGNTLPIEVLGIRKSYGQPLQLINAFEKPVRANDEGCGQPSVKKMNEHLAELETTYGAQGLKVHLSTVETKAGQTRLDAFLDQLLSDDV